MEKQTSPDPTVWDRQTEAFAQRPELAGHLGVTTLERLCADPGRLCLVDYSTGSRRPFKAGLLAALVIVLAKRFREEVPEKRVGIVLPPGIGGVLANLALSLAGKTPVNLNFTLGRPSLESCLERAGIQTMISAAPVREKVNERFPDFPWADTVLDIREWVESLPKPKILLWLMAVKLLPPGWVSGMVGRPKGGGDDEAALLFTSGSVGMPKGVVLSHRNLLGNCKQVIECGVFPENACLMGNLPIFHSFGFTATIWLPLLEGVRVVYVPSPLDYKATAKAVKAEACDIMLGTPTFLRPYLSRVEPEQLRSLKAVVAGAEKTPEGFAEAWEKRFGVPYLEGYGLTETSPVVAVNVPDANVPATDGKAGAGMRPGSVGRLFPGQSAQTLDPDSGQPLPLGKTGILRLRGVNVFRGYLNDPERTESVLKDGWLTTGDLARIDPDGFIFIEGRLSRFSKIGGEMVPHGTVETIIAKVLEVDSADQPMVVVSARTDANKGEALVLISAVEVEMDELRRKLVAEGLPNLWIPRELRRVEAIPLLASGKLELGRLKAIAEGDGAG